MALAKKVEELSALVAPAVAACGFELWGLEFFQQGRHSVLRIFIENTNEEVGVTVEHCSEVSHQVSAILDVEDPIAGEYTLEVSSPGWDRLLFRPDQYARYVGEEVQVRLTGPVAGRRRWKGRVVSADDRSLVLHAEGQDVTIPMLSIDKGNVVAAF